MFRAGTLLLFASLLLGGCSLIVDFDRSLLVDGGPDASLDAGVFDAAELDEGAPDGGDDEG